MNPFPDNFNSSNGSEFGNSNRDRRQDEDMLERDKIVIDPDIQERAAQTTQKLQRLFLILLGIGLGGGVALAIGVVLLLNYLGLTDKPNRAPSPPPAAPTDAVQIHDRLQLTPSWDSSSDASSLAMVRVNERASAESKSL